MAVDGSRFKAVNTRDKNYTPGAIRLRMEQVDANIARYLVMLDTADRQEDRVAELRVARLSERLEALRRQMRQLQVMERAVADAPDHQVSLTDPDARAMATNGKGTGMVGYNVPLSRHSCRRGFATVPGQAANAVSAAYRRQCSR